ncbi:AraC family transcriptional regulator [Streptomyces sp. NPDC056500]|uniref:AraC family transcriptional regulator n=1 Tax=Streptomyces sp. NPDC056500 TaxID=3345840 RepID=UPI00369DA881
MDDALSGLLHEVRPQGALFDRSALNPPWSMRFLERTPLALLTMLGGSAWVSVDGDAPVPLRPGDLVLVRGPEPYTVSDEPGTAPLAFVHEDDRCTTPDGRLILGTMPMCAPEHRDTVLLKGTYQVEGSVSQRVLDALPPIARVPAAPEGCPALGMISQEIDRDVPGRQVVLDRLLDLLLVTTLRDWFDRPEAKAPAWYRAYGDPTVGRALRLIHSDPARPWTVASLASEAGVSRARFAQRFSELVGQPPMTYLTEWRICQAADLLARTDDTVEAVSRRVGYSNAYALSVAFKRTLGVRPSEHRATARAGQPPALARQAG